MFKIINLKNKIMKSWREAWDEALSDDQKNKLKMMLDGGNMLFFFDYKNEVFGAPESGRVTFAKMKDPDDPDNTDGWRKEANFMATSLTKAGQGIGQQRIFGEKDISDIDVLDKEEAYDRLSEFFSKERKPK
jgi:hypothetical protein